MGDVLFLTQRGIPNVSSHLEYELAPEMARLAQSMGVSGLRQAIELDLRRAYGPCLKQLGYSIEVSRRQDPANRRTSRLPARHIVQ